MKLLSRAAAALIVLGLASPCWAGQVKLEIRGGLVTLSAKDASPREILVEWARVGQTRIVNAERVPGGLITLELSGVPESRALDIVLRAVAGYVAAPRVVKASTGSQYDRIMVMAVARPPAGGASPGATATSAPTPPPYDPRGRTYQPQPSLMVDDQDEPVVQQQPQPQPQPVMPVGATQGAAQPGMPTAVPQPQGGATPYQQNQPPAATPPSPAATRPGMTTPGPTVPKPPGSPGGGPGGNQ
jgi:hypothetical protein